MAEPRKCQLTGTVSWSNGETFSGFVLIGIALPTSGDYQYARVALQNMYPPQRIPLWYRIPIIDGQYDTSARIYYNTDLEPPNTKYAAWFYDVHNRQIAGPTALFEVSTGTYTITVPTLTVPGASAIPPTPGTNPDDPAVTFNTVNFVDNEVPTGTIDGANATFTLDYTPSPSISLQLFLNGQLLYQGTAYLLSGKTITMQAGYIPQTGDLLLASYRV